MRLMLEKRSIGLLAALLLVVAASCAADDPVESADGAAADTTEAADAAIDDGDEQTDESDDDQLDDGDDNEDGEGDSGEPMPSLEELQAAIAQTIEAPQTSFNSVMTTRLPGAPGPVVTVTTGSWDEASASGSGVIAPGASAPAEAMSQTVVVDDTYWLLDPANEQGWVGRPLEADPTRVLAVDGTAYLELLAPAIVDVVDVADLPEPAGAIWTVVLAADALNPILLPTVGEPGAVVADGWDGTTEAFVGATVVVGGDGFVSGFHSEFADWWTVVYGESTGETVEGSLSHIVSFQLKQIETEAVAAPCETPDTIDLDGVEALTCEATEG